MWGADPAATKDFVGAAALGAIDAFIQKPVVDPDEQFHLAIAEFLEEWARTHRPRFALIQIVGDRWSEMSHKFRGAERSNRRHDRGDAGGGHLRPHRICPADRVVA